MMSYLFRELRCKRVSFKHTHTHTQTRRHRHSRTHTHIQTEMWKQTPIKLSQETNHSEKQSTLYICGEEVCDYY